MVYVINKHVFIHIDNYYLALFQHKQYTCVYIGIMHGEYII